MRPDPADPLAASPPRARGHEAAGWSTRDPTGAPGQDGQILAPGRDLAARARRWQQAGRPAIVVEITATRGSTPREAGTRMLVAADEVAGTLGGGHLEWQAIEQARQALTRPDAPAWTQSLALGPSLGQCCGGAVTLGYRPLAKEDLARWTTPTPRFVLQLHGAGHVGRAIVRLLADLPCQVQWVDEREDAFPPGEWPAHVHKVCVPAVEAEVAQAPAGAHYLVLTHSHALDLAIVHAILQRPDVGFVGLIGSKSKRARFAHRLAERGVPARQLERLVCPIGMPGIDGKEPEVIAVAVVAQLLAWRG